MKVIVIVLLMMEAIVYVVWLMMSYVIMLARWDEHVILKEVEKGLNLDCKWKRGLTTEVHMACFIMRCPKAERKNVQLQFNCKLLTLHALFATVFRFFIILSCACL